MQEEVEEIEVCLTESDCVQVECKIHIEYPQGSFGTSVGSESGGLSGCDEVVKLKSRRDCSASGEVSLAGEALPLGSTVDPEESQECGVLNKLVPCQSSEPDSTKTFDCPEDRVLSGHDDTTLKEIWWGAGPSGPSVNTDYPRHASCYASGEVDGEAREGVCAGGLDVFGSKLPDTHLALGPHVLSREQGNKLLASRFRSDYLYVSEWPGCEHPEERRKYMLFRGMFKDFKTSHVWRNLKDLKSKPIEVSCAFCNSGSLWDMMTAFCLRRSFEYHDNGEPVVRAFVCENGHVSGAWTDRPLFTVQ